MKVIERDGAADTDRSVTSGEATHALALETSNGSIDINRLDE